MAPLLAAALISGGAQLIGTFADWYSQNKTNYANNQAAREAYDKARRDAVDDWNKNNAYNSPTQQMNRLRQAGLNPHLIYGKGAENTAVMARNTDPKVPNIVAPKISEGLGRVSDTLGNYYQMKQQQTQTDNISANTELLKIEKDNKLMEIAGKGIANKTNQITLDNATALQDSVILKAKLANTQAQEDIESTKLGRIKTQADIDRTGADTKKIIQEAINSKIEASKKKLEVSQTAEQTTKIKQEITNLQTANTGHIIDNKLKTLEVSLREVGINPNDPTYMRIAIRYMVARQQDFKEWWKSISTRPMTKEEIEQLFNK